MGRRRRCNQLLNDLQKTREYTSLKERYKGWEDKEEGVVIYWMSFRKSKNTGNLKEETLDRNVWRTSFGREYGPVVRHTT
jgi:hypothetical protein